jgi:hypothetical protein
MRLTADDLAGLGIALNEARWLGAELDEDRRLATITLATLSLPLAGPPPVDPRVQVLLSPVGRVVVVYTSHTGEVLPLELRDLRAVVESFGGQPVYGWEFIDVPLTIPGEVSRHVELGDGGLTHVLHLFQDGGPKGSLDLWLWFDELVFRSPRGESISPGDIIAGGRRWWDALHSGDPRVSGAGILPLKGNAG